MSEMWICDGVCIDEVEFVERAIYNATGTKADIGVIAKFINREKNTRFYLDRKMNSATEPGQFGDYLWLDTGYTDSVGQPLLICLHRDEGGYVGHFTATPRVLCNRIKSFNSRNVKDIERNFSRFLEKYRKRIDQRATKHIEDSGRFLVDSANVNTADAPTAMAMAMKGLCIEFAGEPVAEEPAAEVVEAKEDVFTAEQEEITLGLLWDKIGEMQTYIDTLLEKLEKNEKSTSEEIAELKRQNNEYKRALTDIHVFMGDEKAIAEAREPEKNDVMGHNLLPRNKKILVLGNADIRTSEMRAIARDGFGFEKADFVFATDYNKVKMLGEIVHSSEKYAAVIFGNCPHKVAGLGSNSSIIEEYKRMVDGPIAIDARTHAGGLKITKQSFRKALEEVYRALRVGDAA